MGIVGNTNREREHSWNQPIESLHVTRDSDVLCLQETWLTQSAVTLDIPGYQVFEQRRNTGKRGGIAIIVRNGIQVLRHIGNEFSQGVCLQVHGGEKLWVGNVYMPPI